MDDLVGQHNGLGGANFFAESAVGAISGMCENRPALHQRDRRVGATGHA